MHPILSQRRRLALYLLAWLPPAFLLAGALRLAGGSAWGPALGLTIPACFLLAFISLASWYVVRANPLGRTPPDRALIAVATAAAASTGIWLVLVGVSLELWLRLRGGASGSLHWNAGVQLPILALGGFLLYLLVAAFHYLLSSFEESRSAERRLLELDVLARETELRLLRAQIDPHFLFNALNSIAALTHSDPDRARRMCTALGEFLREGLRLGGQKRVKLEEELGLARTFLSIEKIRFGERLVVEERVQPGCERCVVPPLILQPLVENAVRHGIARRLEGGTIRLDVSANGAGVRLLVENPVDEAPGESSPSRTSRPAGMGLENVRRRLLLLYGTDASLVTRAERTRFRVELTVPIETAPGGR